MFIRYKVEKTTNYTVVSNQFIKDQDLSLKAKGLLLVVMSLPDDWEFSVEGLAKICKESKNTINTILAQLNKLGYYQADRLREKGRFTGTTFSFAEYRKEELVGKPNKDKSSPQPKKPNMAESSMKKPNMADCSQLSKEDNQVNNKSSKERDSLSNLDFAENEKSHEQSECGRREKENVAIATSAQKKERRVPSLEDARGFFRESGFRSSADKFFYFYQAKGWKGIVDWEAEANLWELREKDNQPKKEPKKDNRGEEYIQFLREQAV